MKKPKKRIARSLLAAGIGAALALGSCDSTPGPFGNLVAHPCDDAGNLDCTHDMSVPDLADSDGPFGNLRPIDSSTPNDGGTTD